MSISKEKYNNEAELHVWVENHIKDFFGDAIYLTGNFFINTKRNKGAKPDGFILDLKNSSWTIIESELISHGVWDHITEQIVRFIVATKNDSAKRKIRNYFFDALEKKGLIKTTAIDLGIPESRVLQIIEDILETTTPDIALFIDEVNEDLEDMIEALNATVRVFKVEKYKVNDKVEFYYPNKNKSTLETTIESVTDDQGKPIESIELLGGGKLINNINRIKIYQLNNQDIISLKYSKYYDREPNFWYGITPTSMEKYEQNNVAYIAFTVGTVGIIKLPYNLLKEYIKTANKSVNTDGSTRHYHIQIRDNPTWQLYTVSNTIDLNEFFFPA